MVGKVVYFNKDGVAIIFVIDLFRCVSSMCSQMLEHFM